jgi:TRAP-type C4-dicarboxylate transport system permease large subunit
MAYSGMSVYATTKCVLKDSLKGSFRTGRRSCHRMATTCIPPTVGMVIYATNAKRATDEMFIEVAHAVADQVTPSS